MKCPSCGYREQQSIEWKPLLGMVMHTCPRCKADFGHAPIKAAEGWAQAIPPRINPKQLFGVDS